jgi:hypothetical protein
MDVYHRDVAGGLFKEVDKKTEVTDTTTPSGKANDDATGAAYLRLPQPSRSDHD